MTVTLCGEDQPPAAGHLPGVPGTSPAKPCENLLVAEALVREGLTHRWVPLLRHAEISRAIATCRIFRDSVGASVIWQEVARVWHCAPGAADLPSPGPSGSSGAAAGSAGAGAAPWRLLCARHERLQEAWCGSPVAFRLNVRQELRRQKLEDLDVLIVEFLAGEEGLVLGHSRGAVSIWEIVPVVPTSATATCSHSCVGGPSPSPALEARVTGVFQTSRRHDVQDLAVSPPPAAQPAALLLGGSIFLAAAVGANAYIWESAGTPQAGKDTAVLAAWELRATLRHSRLFPAPHHGVWSVRLCEGFVRGSDGACGKPRRAATMGEDGVFRAWLFGGNVGMEGQVIWQHSAGDARQVVTALLGAGGDVAVVARADQRCLHLWDTASGKALETVCGAWPSGAGSLPQSAALDSGGSVAIFSSITDAGDGALTLVDLSEVGGPVADAMDDEGYSTDEPGWLGEGPTPQQQMARPVLRVESPLAGPGRVLRLAIPVPVAGALVAVVYEGDASVVLEVWERDAALNGGPSSLGARFRGRVAPLFGNPRLVAVGGRRLVLLDPTTLRSQGELRLLEWRPRPLAAAGTAGGGAAGSTRSGTTASPGGPLRRRVSTRLLSWRGAPGDLDAGEWRCCGCAAGIRRVAARLLRARGAPAGSPCGTPRGTAGGGPGGVATLPALQRRLLLSER